MSCFVRTAPAASRHCSKAKWPPPAKCSRPSFPSRSSRFPDSRRRANTRQRGRWAATSSRSFHTRLTAATARRMTAFGTAAECSHACRPRHHAKQRPALHFQGVQHKLPGIGQQCPLSHRHLRETARACLCPTPSGCPWGVSPNVRMNPIQTSEPTAATIAI